MVTRSVILSKVVLRFTDRGRVECDLNIDEVVVTIIYSDLKITMIYITTYSR